MDTTTSHEPADRSAENHGATATEFAGERNGATPHVSVVISTRNRLPLLRESVETVLGQTYRDLELIVCDDASSDDTPAYVQELQARDERVRSVRHDINIGMAANWNSGVRAARGPLWTKLDDDNRFLPTFLEAMVAVLEATPAASWAFCDEWFMDDDGVRDAGLTETASERYGRANLAEGAHREDAALLAARQSIGINATVFRRSALGQVQGFNETVGSLADTDLYLRLAAAGFWGSYVPQRLSEYRVHRGSFTTVTPNSLKKAEQALTLWKSFAFEGAAEQVRREQLAASLSGLARITLLSGDAAAARTMLNEARQVRPNDRHLLAAQIVAGLPGPLREAVLRMRYKADAPERTKAKSDGF